VVDLGIASRLCSADELLPAALEHARRPAKLPPRALQRTKRLLLATRDDAVRAARRREDEAFALRVGSPENVGAIHAFFASSRSASRTSRSSSEAASEPGRVTHSARRETLWSRASSFSSSPTPFWSARSRGCVASGATGPMQPTCGSCGGTGPRARAGAPVSRRCVHVKGHGGAKSVVRWAAARLRRPPFVLRTDVRGYDARIGPVKLVELSLPRFRGHPRSHEVR
jgi:hypothetical protein